MEKDKIKILFFGTPEFAVPSLELLSSEFEVVAVITKPDKPAGRGKKVTPPPVKVKAQELSIRVLQPSNFEEVREFLSQIQPDLGVVVAYGRIIPNWLVNLPRHGTINLHPSLLPKLRGASPIQWALLEGLKETGVSVIKLSEELDAGDILAQEKVKILESDDYLSLSEKLAKVGAKLLLKVIPEFVSGNLKPRPQEHEKATYCGRITKEMGLIDWNLPAEKICRMVRALNPWPSTYTFLRGKRLIITKASVVNEEGRPGVVLKTYPELVVSAGEKGVKIERLKPEGKREMTSEEFLRGYKVEVGEELGK